MIENTGEKVLEFATKQTRESRKTLESLVSVIKALRDGRLNYVFMCASAKSPTQPELKLPTDITMTFHHFDALKEEELQIMIDFLQEGGDNLIKAYLTRTS